MSTITPVPAITRSGHAEPSPVRLVPRCTHIKTDGARCGSPAMSATSGRGGAERVYLDGESLCYHHSAVKTALGKVAPVSRVSFGAHSPIPFVFPEDAASLQINFFLLLQAVNEDRIGQRTATILHRILRSMADNLKRPLAAETQADPALHQPEAGSEPIDASTAATNSADLPAQDEPAQDEPASSDSVPAHEDTPQSPAEAAAALVALRGGRPLSDLERQYFSLPPENPGAAPKQSLGLLGPEAQRAMAMCCEKS